MTDDEFDVAGPSAEPETDDESDGGTTTNTARRHWATNDGIAWTLTFSMVVLIGLSGTGIVDFDLVPRELIVGYVAAFGTAIVWAFGSDAVAAWRGNK